MWIDNLRRQENITLRPNNGNDFSDTPTQKLTNEKPSTINETIDDPNKRINLLSNAIMSANLVKKGHDVNTTTINNDINNTVSAWTTPELALLSNKYFPILCNNILTSYREHKDSDKARLIKSIQKNNPE